MAVVERRRHRPARAAASPAHRPRRPGTGKELTGHETLADGWVRATFAGGTTTTSDPLIGADGIGSAARSVLAPDMTPEGTDVRVTIGRTPLTNRFARLVPGFGTGIQVPDVMLMLGLVRFRERPRATAARLAPEVRLPDTTDYVRWAMVLPPRCPASEAVDAVSPSMSCRNIVPVTARICSSVMVNASGAWAFPRWAALRTMSTGSGSGWSRPLREKYSGLVMHSCA